MDNRYLYRAKSVVDNKWIVVYLKLQKEYDTDDNEIILTQVISLDDFRAFKDATDDNTVCQCTGLKDKNGKLIFEGDIVKCDMWGTKTFYVLYSEHFQRLHLMPLTDGRLKKQYGRLGVHIFDWLYPEVTLEIIGNIHDNPELLDEGAKCND